MSGLLVSARLPLLGWSAVSSLHQPVRPFVEGEGVAVAVVGAGEPAATVHSARSRR
jgi:hypothetical protein